MLTQRERVKRAHKVNYNAIPEPPKYFKPRNEALRLTRVVKGSDINLGGVQVELG
jgi:hypothetical protein